MIHNIFGFFIILFLSLNCVRTVFYFKYHYLFSSFTAAWILWKADRKFGAAGLALAVCIGFSRLYLFVHYPTDVLGGAVLGIACAQGIYLLAKRYMRKKACQ